MMKQYLGLVIAVILSFFALKPLFNNDYFPLHDSLQAERIYEMAQALQDGQFPVRWVKDLGYGYGYPLFNFYAPLPYYAGAFFYLLGFNLVVAAKLMFGTGILLAGISMYLFAREIWGEWGGILSAILYQYLPYHAVQIYVRGSVGEYWVYGLLPLLALVILQILRPKLGVNHPKDPTFKSNPAAASKRWAVFGGFVYALIILSHNISALLITGFMLLAIVIYSAIAIWNKHPLSTIYYLLSTLAVGLALSAFFWLPAFVEKDLTKVNKIITGGSYYADHFVQWRQLWDSPWGYGGSAPPGKIDGMSFKLGKFHIFLAITVSLLLVFSKTKQRYWLLAIGYWLLAISVFMMLSVSQPVYRLIPILKYLQFPWRFLMYAGFALSVIGGGGLYFIRGAARGSKIVFTLVATFLLVANMRALPTKLAIAYFKPVDYFSVSEKDFSSENNLKWDSSSRSDEYLPLHFRIPQNASQVASTRLANQFPGKLTIIQDKTQLLSLLSKFKSARNIKINIAYFPGWKVYIDGVEKDITVLNRGFTVNIPSGMHKIVIKFNDTKVRIIADLISLSSLLLLGGIILQNRWWHS